MGKPHAVCIPYPAQGHINPMLKVAKLLHSKGFHITFVHTEYNHKRLLKSRGPNSLDGLPDFAFETIPDGLPPTDADATQDIPSLCESTSKTCLAPLRHLLSKLNNSTVGIPPVTCVISDGVMSFTLEATEEIGIPNVLFWTTSACGFLGYVHYANLIAKGLTPLKESQRASKASAIILNTFDDYEFEHDVLSDLSSILIPPIYSIGPLHLLLKNIPQNGLDSIGSNLWREELECFQWLNSKKSKSVVYVNFGSITVMTPKQMVEFAWGLANSEQEFLWIIRPDIVKGKSAMLPHEFVEETKERGLLASWCPQEQVMNHPSIGGFLTHSGWNSTIESVSCGVPMVCWPFFAEQQTNCRFACSEWGIGMEIDNDVKREEVEKLVRELMEREKGEKMRSKAMELKNKAKEATTSSHGSSYLNFNKLVDEVLVP
ncbi:hypothetical protein EZV62_027690 [Acer yangbiense]|uniref:Glycosyltransferase n=1 Tax=Acer yangbiense TaxID=1000413 RepID=A0A5C7GWD5_9ROSI|nr:hypothetical protein EZV62_027690 [Acer yangbiense]